MAPESKKIHVILAAALLLVAGVAAWLLARDPGPEPAPLERAARRSLPARAPTPGPITRGPATDRTERLERAIRRIQRAAEVTASRPGASTTAGQQPARPYLPPIELEAPDAEADAGELETIDGAPRRPLPEPWPVDREGIKSAIDWSKDELKECYDGWLKVSPDLAGKLVVGFTIGQGEGEDKLARITAVQLEQNDVGHAVMEGCVLNVFSNLRFRRPDGGGEVKVRYPVNFSSEAEE